MGQDLASKDVGLRRFTSQGGGDLEISSVFPRRTLKRAKPNISYPKGGTGYQPVPLGHWPGGMDVTSLLSGGATFPSVSSSFRPAGCRLAQAGSLCYRSRCGRL